MVFMRVLVTGASGFVGFKLAKALVLQKHRVSGTFSTHNQVPKGCKSFELEVSDEKKVSEIFKAVQPQVVFHLSALTNVDLCETNNELALRVNVDGTSIIAQKCAEVSAKMVFVSTSAVFEGGKVFQEDSDYCPANFYGKTKMFGEKEVKKKCKDFAICRTDHPFGWKMDWQKDNSVTRNLKKLKNGQEVLEVTDWFNTPTYVENLVDALLETIGKELVGAFHLVGPDFLNRFDFAVKTAKAFGFDHKMVKKFHSRELSLPAKRQNCRLDTKKTTPLIKTEFLGVDESLKQMALTPTGN